MIFGAGAGIVTVLLFSFISQALAGGIISVLGEQWLYMSVIPPFIVAFAWLGLTFRRNKELFAKKIWFISLACALLIALYSGTAGALLGEAISRGGFETLNVAGTLGWGTAYAVILLPVTVPYARLLIGLFIKFLKKGCRMGEFMDYGTMEIEKFFSGCGFYDEKEMDILLKEFAD